MSAIRRTLSKSSDYLDTLATTLRDLGGPTTIPHELTQNADDAGNARIVRFTVNDEALIVWNDGTFTDCRQDGGTCPWERRCDLHAFRRFAGRTKAKDSTTTGAFGVGFTSVYQITDAPELLYDDQHWILDEMAPESERLQACDGECGNAHGAPGTTFVLPWARAASPLRQKLAVLPVDSQAIEELEDALHNDAPATVLFLQHITTIEIKTSRADYSVVREEVGDGIFVDDTTSRTHWITIKGDFAAEAARLAGSAAGLIDPNRPTAVTIALRADDGPTSGVLYATLPTQTPSGLPGHVNASFFPRTDRKTVRFESSGFESDWNRAAIGAVAHCLAGSAGILLAEIGVPGFWELLGAITDLDRRAETTHPNHAARYYSELRKVVPGLSSIDVFGGARALPRDSFLPSETDIYESGEALTKIGLPIVARHLHRRLHTSSVYAAYEIRPLTARHVVERLRLNGTTQVFDPSTGPLSRDQVFQILDALEHLPGKVENLEGVSSISIAPCRDGRVAPPSQVIWPASEDDATLFEILVDDLLVADIDSIEEHCPGLRDTCQSLDAATAGRILQSIEPDNLGAMSNDLLDWLSRNLTAQTPRETRMLIAQLPIFPTASGFMPLTTLSLPNDFRDPIAVASLVAESAALDYHKLLIDLGARPLNIVDYVSLHAIPAAVAGRVSVSQAIELLQLIAAHQPRLESMRQVLAVAPLVPCTDHEVHSALEVHLPSLEITKMAPDLPIAITGSVPPAVLDWLGVKATPSDRAVEIAVERLAVGTAAPDLSVVEAVLKTLHSREKLSDRPPDFLATQPWLPLKRGGMARPNEVLPTNARHLFGLQGKELGLAADIQGRYFSQLTWLGMPATPPITTVVAYLQQCASTGIEMSQDVYRVLSNNVGHPSVKQLRGSPCICVGPGRFVSASTVFWQESPFGRWATTLPEAWRVYMPFFDVVGVKNEAGPNEIAAILRAIRTEFGPDPVDSVGVEAVHASWRRLSDLLDDPDASSVLHAVGRSRSTLDPRDILSRPDELFFEDSQALHRRFPQLLHNVISRVHGTWKALTAAGVRRVEELIKARVVDLDSAIESDLPARIKIRTSAFRRVLVDDQVLEKLLELVVLRTDSLQVVYRAELHGYPYEIGPEEADAIYLPDQHQLVHRAGAPDRVLARELARAIAPDDDPGPLAMRLEPILRAQTAEEAHRALDDFGVATLDIIEHQAPLSPTAEVGDDVPTPGVQDHEQTEIDREVRVTERPGNEQEEGDGSAANGGPRAHNESGRRSSDRRHVQDVGTNTPTRAGGRTGKQTRLRSYVTGVDDDEGHHGTIGDEAPDLSPIDEAGVARVVEYERRCGRDPHEMTHSNPGFDLESLDGAGELARRIEIKSTGGQWSVAGVMLSRRQHQQAVEDGDLFWLYVVENAQEKDYRIFRIQNPAGMIDYFGFDGGWKEIAEPNLEPDE